MAHLPEAGLEAGREALRRFLTGDDDLDTMLANIATVATGTVPGCEAASITMLRHERPTTPVFTGEVARQLDETQYASGDGPCLAAMRHRGVERLTVATDTRWPPFATAALDAGVTAVLAVPLVADERPLGALNLYSTTIEAFDDDARDVACLLADQLGVAAANVARYADALRLADELRTAMESRAVIEQAKGVLMASERCGPDRAFEILKQASQHQNRKLRDVAAEIVARYDAAS
jgi:GAF domain-containing protein